MPTAVNPWTWQEPLGYSQAILVEQPSRWLLLAGQTSADDQGVTRAPGDLRAQVGYAVDNLETVLQQAGFALTDVVRMNVFTTDMEALMSNFDALVDRLGPAVVPAGSVFEVSRLAQDGLVVELEATAAR